MENIISFDGVCKEYPMDSGNVVALNNVTFSISAGEFVSIVGPSGSGKSTCMNIMGCLDIPDSGTYRFCGRNVSSIGSDTLADIRNQHIGFVFQQYNLLGRHTILENVEMPLIYAGLPTMERRERAAYALELVGLQDRINHMPNQLSGGQQQRVSIARAIVNDPTIILADEPTGALDTKTGNDILALMRNLNEKGNTIIIITHNNDIAMQTKRIVRLQDGEIVEDIFMHDKV